MKQSIIISVLAIALAVGMTLRIHLREDVFMDNVRKSQSLSAGYDRDFIDLVNRLERELALRAQFGFTGKKDPMTGQRRVIAEPIKIEPVQVAAISVQSKPTKPAVVKQEQPKQTLPSVRVTAIIYDDVKQKFTAMMMEGDRTLVLEVGDSFGPRKITAITNGTVTATDGIDEYTYDLRGQVSRRPLIVQPKGGNE